MARERASASQRRIIDADGDGVRNIDQFESEISMLIYRRTSIMDSSAQTLVNTVNCVGVMGKGIALDFKKREPEMFESYKRICAANLLEPGKLWLWKGRTSWVLNFPTKVHWRHPSKLEWIEAGLKKFASAYLEHGIREVSFPRLGCGNGGLDWNEVRPLMEKHLSDLPIPVYIHDYSKDIGLPEHMEAISQQLQNDPLPTRSYEDFVCSLNRAVSLGGDRMQELETNLPFKATFEADRGLTLELSNASWLLDTEDLRSAWLALRGGLVTKDKAALSSREGGAPLVSLMSVLPHVRPIEIQRRASENSEIAVELRRGHSATAASQHVPV